MPITTISVITINYNRLDDTLDLLSSLSKAKIPPQITVEIIVVDNHSLDKPNAAITKKFPKVKVINSNQNLGFSGGNNLGIRHALKNGNQYLVLINNDCLVDKDFFEKIICSAITNNETGIVSGLIYFAPHYEFEKNYQKSELGKVIWYGGGFFDRANVLGSHRHVNQVDKGELIQSETDFVSGALLITKNSVIEKVGLLDDRYFMYLEDLEFSLRIKQSGYKIIFDPNIKIWHKVGQSSAIGSTLNDYFITRNRLLLGSIYSPFRTQFALFREAMRKLLSGTQAQKMAIIDFFCKRFGGGSFIK